MYEVWGHREQSGIGNQVSSTSGWCTVSGDMGKDEMKQRIQQENKVDCPKHIPCLGQEVERDSKEVISWLIFCSYSEIPEAEYLMKKTFYSLQLWRLKVQDFPSTLIRLLVRTHSRWEYVQRRP